MIEPKRSLPSKFLCVNISIRALPGAPMYQGDNQFVIDKALEELEIYKEAGVDAVMFENDYDLPYTKTPLNPEAKEVLTDIAQKFRANFDGPLGVQVLEGNHMDALDIAVAADFDFLRVEAFVFAHVGGGGIIEACSGELLRKRTELGVNHIKVFADVKKKHCSSGLTTDLTIADEAKQAQFFLVDGVIVTSKFTGSQPSTDELESVNEVAKVPVIIGSGMTHENIETFMPLADGFIVGSDFRVDGGFLAETDPVRLSRFMDAFKPLQEKYRS